MQVTDKHLKFWSRLKEDGDVKAVADLLGKDISVASRILSGKQKQVATEDVLKINDFYNKRSKSQEKANKI